MPRTFASPQTDSTSLMERTDDDEINAIQGTMLTSKLLGK
jgi:hypothetical protein